MFSESELGYMLEEYKIILNEKMSKHKVISVLLLLALIVVVITLYLLGFASKEPLNYLIPIYGGGLLIPLLIYTMFSFGNGSIKPFYEIIVKKVIEKINLHMEVHLEYVSEKNIKFNHNVTSGIFVRQCRSKIRMHIKGKTSNNNSFDLYELSLISGGGNSQQTHLNGIYIVTNNNTHINQQIRTNGRPHLKGMKYQRIEDDYQYKLFLDENLSEKDINRKYKDIFSLVMRDRLKTKGYLSVIEKETHFALHPFKLYKNRKLTLENLNIVYEKIKDLIELVDKLSINEF